jgi:GNAT superfamily N-acetyltransferase
MPNPDAGTPTATSDDGIRIRHYDDWMLPQVIDLFVAEYASDREEEKRAFLEFYEHPFQRAHGIRLVALDSERVCGFQSFFYWPYMYRGRELRTFQSGRSLISPDYRGRRIFARLLNFLAESEDRPEIDCLMVSRSRCRTEASCATDGRILSTWCGTPGSSIPFR